MAVSKQFQELEKHCKETKQQPEETLELITQETRIIHIFDREGDIALSL